MDNLTNYIIKYASLFLVFAIFIIVLFGSVILTLKSNKKKNIVLRGLLMDMSNKNILSLTLVLVNFVLLTFYFIFKYDLNISFIIVSMLLILISNLISFNLKNLFINVGINIVSILVIYLGLIVQHLEIPSGALHYILKVCTNIFGLLFFIFILFKYIKNACLDGGKK